MIKVEVKYREEINDKERSFRYDDEVTEGLKMFNKLIDLQCAEAVIEMKAFGPGVHVLNHGK